MPTHPSMSSLLALQLAVSTDTSIWKSAIQLVTWPAPRWLSDARAQVRLLCHLCHSSVVQASMLRHSTAHSCNMICALSSVLIAASTTYLLSVLAVSAVPAVPILVLPYLPLFTHLPHVLHLPLTLYLPDLPHLPYAFLAAAY